MHIQDTNQNYAPEPSQTAYEQNMETRLRELGAQIDIWTAKAESIAAINLADLKLKREKAHIQLQELKKCSGEAWAEFKIGMDKCFDDLKKGMDELKLASENAVGKFQKH